jgi:hypothetical protein
MSKSQSSEDSGSGSGIGAGSGGDGMSASSENDHLRLKLTSLRDDISCKLNAMYDNFKNIFDMVNARQERLEIYLKMISDHCREGIDDRHGSPSKVNSILKLNVGGDDVNIRRSLAFEEEPDHNILSILFLNRWDFRLIKNRNGRIFLNVNPAWIAPIVNLLRQQPTANLKLQSIPEMTGELESGFNAVASYYNLGCLFRGNRLVLSGESSIPTFNMAATRRTLYTFLHPELSSEQQSREIKLDLIYRGSRDGFSDADFHSKTDGKSSLVFVIEDLGGNVYGRYADGKWMEDPENKDLDNSFLFSLTGGAEKFPRKENGTYVFSGQYIVHYGRYLRTRQQTSSGAQYGKGANRTFQPLHTSSSFKTFPVREIEMYQIRDAPAKGKSLTRQSMEVHSCQLPNQGFSGPLRYWILAAVNRHGTQCSDFQSKLVYASSRDGFTPGQFHAKCDGRPMTVCIVKDNRGHTLGCFSDVAWSSSVSSVSTANSFVFSLGGAVSSYSMERRNVIQHDPRFFFSFGTCFQISGDRRILLSMDGIQVNAPHPSGLQFGQIPLSALEIAVYEIAPRTLESQLSKLTFGFKTQLNENVNADANSIVEDIEKMATQIQQTEEKLLLELLWIEHLSAPSEGRNIRVGMQAEWQAMTSMANACRGDPSGLQTMQMIEEVMARLHIDMTGNNHEKKGTVVDDEVVSYNVGGTIIAVLRSTLVRQAPNSAFASRFSGRWSEQDNYDIEDGHICLVRNWLMIIVGRRLSIVCEVCVIISRPSNAYFIAIFFHTV